VKICIALIVICAARIALAAAGAEWKPAKSPLMTRWAKDVKPDHVLSEYPRPQMVRKAWLNLNGLWEFSSADQVSDPPIGRKLNDQILVPFCMESALSGVGKHCDHSWYRRTFTVPAEWKDKHVLLHFGAVDYESVVWVNGKQLGAHKGGYDAFELDVTASLKGAGEQQELVVGVIDTTDPSQARGKQTTEPKGIWYTPCSGIWQTVWLEPVAKDHVEDLKIVPDLDGVTVSVKGSAKVEVLDGERVVASGGSGTKLAIAKAKVWSPDSPFLYGLRISQGDDVVESYVGLRKIEVSPDEKGTPRIKLNGKEIMMVGPLDQGFWPDGIYTAPTDEALKYDLEMTKKLGFNCLRKHVKVEPQRFYYWCDKLGLLVWQDMPSALANKPGDWQRQFEAEMKQLVDQHRNSPSIAMWVPFNEGWGQEAYGKEGTTRVVEMIKKLDPTRLVNNASGWTDAEAGDVHDMHSYPGPSAPAVEKQRAIVLGEFGGLGLGIKGHMWEDKAWGYQNMASEKDLTDRYERLLGRLWELHDHSGLCAGIYTQTEDVESESNGFMTYDREVLKMDEARVRQANLGKGPRVVIQPLVKTAREEPAEWKYTTEKPADGWEKTGFDDSSWKTGKSGFGTTETPNTTVNTTWNTPDIWLRREVDLPADALNDLELFVFHDDACEIYINGGLAGRLRNFSSDYVEQRLREDAKKAVKPGKNVVAVHCHQAGGGQYIDLGFVKLVESNRSKP
jgi:hypothetical protein